MEKFIVSARKYRPQTFDTVVGQSHITTTLKNAIKHQQLAHAFLFCGPRGVGKTTCARILAKTINCEKQTKDGEACNKCISCTSFNDGASMNYFELDAASNNSVDNIRDLVDQVRFVPQTGRYKVYVIDEVHMLSSSAFNAFLKTLEEPPPYAIFILATTEKHKILPTILSRCQIFDFKRITIQDTVTHLEEIAQKEDIKADKASLQVIAQKSEGCMRDALSILDKIVSFTNGELQYSTTLEHLNILDADCYFKLLEQMQQQDLAGALVLYDDINRKGFEGDLVLNGFAEFIRNLLVCKDEKAAGLLEVVDSFRDKYISTAKKVSAPLLISALNILNEAEINYKAARNKRLHTELALIRLCYLQQAIEISAEPQGLNKKKLVEAKPLAFRNIQPFLPGKATGSVGTNGNGLTVKRPAPKNDLDKPKLIIEEPVGVSSSQPVANTQPGEKLSPIGSTLKEIRDGLKGAADNGNKTNTPLDLSVLQSAWAEYVAKLKEVKNSGASSYEYAILRIIDGNSFEVITANTIERKFIEDDRNQLFAFLREKLQNKLLKFSVIIEEKNGDRPVVQPILSSKDQYLKMAEQFPMVKELRDRLRLELDY